MSSSHVQAFPEGQTEEAVLRGLARFDARFGAVQSRRCQGETNLGPTLDSYLKEERDIVSSDRGALKLLVVRDQDERAISAVGESVQHFVRRHVEPFQFEPHPAHPRLLSASTRFLGTETPRTLRIALFVSGDPDIQTIFPHVTKFTMDDHLLRLALLPQTAQKMLQMPSTAQSGLDADKLIAKVTKEIPALLAANGMNPFGQSKHHVRFYTALLGQTISVGPFAEKVLTKVEPTDIRTHLAALFAAMDWLSQA